MLEILRFIIARAFKVLAFSLAVMIGCSNMPQIAYATDELVTEVTETEVSEEEASEESESEEASDEE